MRVRLLSAALLVATACTPVPAPGPTPPAPGTPPVTPPPQPPPTPTAGGIRLGPSALRYLVHQRLHVEQEFQGQTHTIEQGVRIYLSATISGPADSLGYPVTFTIDSIATDSGSTIPPSGNLAAARGLRFGGRVSPTGRFQGGVASDSALGQAFGQVLGTLRNFYPRLPPTGLTVGAAWTDTLTTTDRAAVDVQLRSLDSARATAWEDRGGVRCVRLEIRSAYTVVGAGEQNGQPLEVTGTGTRAALLYVAADGRYLGGEVHDTSAISINLPLQGLTVPVRQVSRSVVSVLP